MFKIGQKVIWIAYDPGVIPMEKKIFEGEITKIGTSGVEASIYVDNHHKAEDQLYTAFVWPDIPETRQLLQEILDQTKRHKEEEKALATRMLQLSNEMVRRGLK